MTAVVPMEIKGLRAALEEKAAEFDQAAASLNDETGDGKFVVTSEKARQIRRLGQDMTELKTVLDSAEIAARIKDWNSRGPASLAGDDAREFQHGRVDAVGAVKSLSDRLFSSPEWKAMQAAKFRPGSLGSHQIEGCGLNALALASQLRESKDVFTAMAGDLPPMSVIGSSQDVGYTERMLRPGRVRDLFPSERTTANMLYGLRETGYTNRAAVVPERTAADGSAATGGPTDVFGLKPRSDIQLVPYSVGIATIAHVMYIHRNVLDDEPRMRGILDRDMIDGVKMVEDEQLLYGDGVGDNTLGLTQQPGIQLYDPGAGGATVTDKRSAQIRRAITRAILAYFQPTGVVLHALDWEDIELETDANGQYTIATNIAVGGEKRLWRLNLVDTPAMHEGRYLVGAFGTGAKVYDRQSVTIDVSTENRDMFERNAYTLRAEERLGLVVDRPESFVYGTLRTPA